MTTPATSSPRRLIPLACRFGGLAGAAGTAWLAAQLFLGFYSPGAMVAGYVAPVAAIIIGMMRWRDRGTDGATTFAGSLRVGLVIGFVYALAMTFGAWACAAIRPERVVDEVARVYTGILQQRGMPADEVAKTVQELRQTLTPAVFAKPFFATSLIASLVVSLIAAMIIPRQRI